MTTHDGIKIKKAHRRSAVERLEETKANYVKTERVLDCRQEFEHSSTLHVSTGPPIDVLLRGSAKNIFNCQSVLYTQHNLNQPENFNCDPSIMKRQETPYVLNFYDCKAKVPRKDTEKREFDHVASASTKSVSNKNRCCASATHETDISLTGKFECVNSTETKALSKHHVSGNECAQISYDEFIRHGNIVSSTVNNFVQDKSQLKIPPEIDLISDSETDFNQSANLECPNSKEGTGLLKHNGSHDWPQRNEYAQIGYDKFIQQGNMVASTVNSFVLNKSQITSYPEIDLACDSERDFNQSANLDCPNSKEGTGLPKHNGSHDWPQRNEYTQIGYDKFIQQANMVASTVNSFVLNKSQITSYPEIDLRSDSETEFNQTLNLERSNSKEERGISKHNGSQDWPPRNEYADMGSHNVFARQKKILATPFVQGKSQQTVQSDEEQLPDYSSDSEPSCHMLEFGQSLVGKAPNWDNFIHDYLRNDKDSKVSDSVKKSPKNRNQVCVSARVTERLTSTKHLQQKEFRALPKCPLLESASQGDAYCQRCSKAPIRRRSTSNLTSGNCFAIRGNQVVLLSKKGKEITLDNPEISSSVSDDLEFDENFYEVLPDDPHRKVKASKLRVPKPVGTCHRVNAFPNDCSLHVEDKVPKPIGVELKETRTLSKCRVLHNNSQGSNYIQGSCNEHVLQRKVLSVPITSYEAFQDEKVLYVFEKGEQWKDKSASVSSVVELNGKLDSPYVWNCNPNDPPKKEFQFAIPKASKKKKNLNSTQESNRLARTKHSNSTEPKTLAKCPGSRSKSLGSDSVHDAFNDLSRRSRVSSRSPRGSLTIAHEGEFSALESDKEHSTDDNQDSLSACDGMEQDEKFHCSKTSDYVSRSSSFKRPKCSDRVRNLVSRFESKSRKEASSVNSERKLKSVSRSKSDVGYRYSHNFGHAPERKMSSDTELERFFTCMGLDTVALNNLTSPPSNSAKFFDNISSVNSNDHISSIESIESYSTPRKDGLRNRDVVRHAPAETSIVEKNARVVKWLYSINSTNLVQTRNASR